MVGFNNLELMKQRFSVMKMTLTYRAGARDPLSLKKSNHYVHFDSKV